MGSKHFKILVNTACSLFIFCVAQKYT